MSEKEKRRRGIVHKARSSRPALSRPARASTGDARRRQEDAQDTGGSALLRASFARLWI